MGRFIPAMACLGLLVSSYAFYVESRKFADPTYEALCDLSAQMSCSKVLTSSYGHILSHWGLVPKDSPLDLANASLGSVYYAIMLFSPLFPKEFVMFLSLVSVAFSAYLGYVLKYILEDLCLVCLTSYVVNFLIFIGAVGRMTSKSKDKSG